MPTLLSEAEGNTEQGVNRKPCDGPRGRRPCTCREVYCTEAGRSPPGRGNTFQVGQGRLHAVILRLKRWTSRIRS
jgi:hypothetical protein